MLEEDVKASIVNQTRSKFQIALIKLVNFEVKNDKFEPKVVVFQVHGQRLMIYSNKSPSKLELKLHYLDIKSIESKTAREVKFTYGENKSLRLASATEGKEIDEIIFQIGADLKMIFPLLHLEMLIPRIDLSPAERMNSLWKKLDSTVFNDLSACSGFSRMYVCICDLYGCNIVEEIVWDLDTIYLSQASRTLYLRDFDHLSLRDHVPLLGALQYNEWFSGVDASNMKMSTDAFAEVLKVVKKNISISEWNLSTTGLKSDFIQKFASAITSNLTTKIVSLNLSGNAIEDRGLSYLSDAVAGMVHGMQSINLSQCSISVKGVNRLMEGVAQNHIMANTLDTLNLSDNNLKGDELLPLYTFLAQPNVIRVLDLSNTETPLDSLFAALSRGSVQHMEELNVSGNFFTAKKGRELKISQSWKQFFSSVLVLTKLNMSNNKLPPQAMKEMLLGLSSNVNTPSITLDLSSNEMKSEGGLVLGGCVANLANIHGLDLSDNGLDSNLHEILPWFGKNGTIHHLSIGKNFSQLRNKALQQALDALVSAIQDDHCALESLSIADSRLRLDTTVVINALGSNRTLKSLDISGNQMGDIGAKMLAKALTINSTLTSVVWDRNSISATGLRDVGQSLQRNFTMLEMPLPIFDIAACARVSPDVIHSASMQIQTCLQRNHAPQKMAYDQCYRLQQGFLVSSAQSIIDRRVHEIHELMNSLCETDNLSPEGFSETNKLLSDADKAKQILMSLQTVAIKCEESPSKFSECVKQVIALLNTSVNSQLEETRKEMMSMVSGECRTVMNDQETKSTLESGAQSRGQLSQSEVGSLIDKHLVNDIQSKISSLNFNVAFYIAEAVIDKILDLLNNKHDELQAMQAGSGPAITVDDVGSPASEETMAAAPGMTYLGDMSGSRLSVMNTLRRRPQSILVRYAGDANSDLTQEMKVESLNIGDLDEADESFKSRKPSGSVTPLATDEPQLHHLPDVDAAPALKHLNKERPKRAKKQAARRPVPAAAISADQAENGIDVVVDDFFKPATVSQTPVVITTPATKPRAGSKADKGDDSPKLNKKSTKSSNKEKQENDKKKGSRTSSGAKGMIATGISNFFKKKPKPEKPVDQTDTKSAESTPSAPQRPERASQSHQTPTPKSRAGSAVIPDQPELSELKTPGTENAQLSAAAVKTGSLERTADPMSASTISTISEDGGGEHGAPIPAPKRKPMGFGMPGMTGGLLAEMQAKRNTMQQPQQPKPASRAPPAKTEEATSPPARPQPPLLKPTTPTSEHKKEEPTPPVRPSPPKPVAAPREAMKPLPAPAPAPAAAPTSTATPAPATKSKPPPPILRPKPPKVSPKPGGRPVTMTELPGRSPGASKAAPPKPPPPDPSKRQTYVAPKLFSPTKPAPPAFPKMTPESSPVVEKKPPIVESVTVSEDAASNPPDEPPSISDNPDIPKPVIQEPSTASLTPAERGPPAEVNTCVPEEQEQDGEKLKSAASQGDISAAEKQTSGTEVTNRNMIDSTNSRDSIAEEISAVNLRTSSRSSSVRLSNGSTSSDKRLSTPLTLSARVEDGPVLQPPPPKKRQSAEQSSHTDNAGTDSGEESLV